MSEDIQFGQLVTETPMDDGSVEIITEGFHNGRNSIKQQRKVSVETTRQTLASDVIRCLEALKSGTHELTIKIVTDKFYDPQRIEKTYTVYKKKLK